MQVTSEPRYNLFRFKGERDLCCAVPETRAMPRFLTDQRWEYGGTIDRVGVLPAGFHKDVAAFSAKVNGFYFFQQG